MSRFAIEFENLPIHALLDETQKILATPLDNVDEELEAERLRLAKGLQFIFATVEGLSPDLAPISKLNEVYENWGAIHYT